MDGLVSAVIVYIIYDMLCKLLPKSKPYIKKGYKSYIDWRIARCVKKAEKIFVGKKLGKQRKAWVLERTQKYNARLIKMNATIDDVIEQAVSILKVRGTTAQKNLQTAASTAINDGVQGAADAVKSKLTKEE